jgi:non-haem Fe2+, alpha-ketoglutarate-dependent halogenase
VLRAELEASEQARGGPLRGAFRHKSHLLFPWLNELVRDPRLLDAVEDVLGSDLLCWNTNLFVKEPQDPGYVSWHQDATYWGLSAPFSLTAWVALSPSTPENGCVRVLPKSHLAAHCPMWSTPMPPTCSHVARRSRWRSMRRKRSISCCSPGNAPSTI